MDNATNTNEKIILPENLQREMIKFFMKTSMLKIAEAPDKEKAPDKEEAPDKKEQHAPKIQNEGC